MMSPCKDCTNRHINCHASCDDYSEYKIKTAELNEKIRQVKRAELNVELRRKIAMEKIRRRNHY